MIRFIFNIQSKDFQIMAPAPRYASLILDLLQNSPLGLTPGGILELGQEAGWLGSDSRAVYQRILRTLKVLHNDALLLRSGKRYVLPPDQLVASYWAGATHAVALALKTSYLPRDIRAWQTAFHHAVEVQIRDDAPLGLAHGPSPPGRDPGHTFC